MQDFGLPTLIAYEIHSTRTLAYLSLPQFPARSPITTGWQIVGSCRSSACRKNSPFYFQARCCM